MGTCISKCCLSSLPHPPNININNNNPSPPPQDKLVILHSPLPPSSSSSSSASSSAFSSCTSTGTCSSSSSSSTTSKPKPYSNDFLLSCAKENPHIIVLDPHKYHAPKPRPQGACPVLTRQQRGVQCSVRLPAKRERSSSPQQQRSIARQKSFRGSEMGKQPAVLSKPTRTLSSPNNVQLKDKQRVRGRSEKIRPLSPCNSLHRLNLKENPIVEDINNPLISMECFIFLWWGNFNGLLSTFCPFDLFFCFCFFSSGFVCLWEQAWMVA